MSRTFQPPRVASWLVDLFISGEHTESISGDLLEEFSDLASKSGVACARRWYWRQSLKTIAFSIATPFRAAPWSIVITVVGGYVLLTCGLTWPERGMMAVLDFCRHHVTPYYTQQQVQTYLFVLGNAILIGHLLMSLLTGSIVAAVAKGREIVATVMLGFVWALTAGTLLGVLISKQSSDTVNVIPILVYDIGISVMIVVGGVIVRQSRSANSHHPSGAYS